MLFNIFVYWLLGQWLKPINKMLEAIEKIGRGGFDTRLPHFNVPEFRSIALNFNAMGTSLQKTMIENKRLGLIAEQTADAVIIHDEKMNISFWNNSAQRIFGYKKKEVLGKSANLIVPKSLFSSEFSPVTLAGVESINVCKSSSLYKADPFPSKK